MYTPLNYNQVTTLTGSYFPVSVKSYNNMTFAYWERSLFQRAASVFNFKLPDNWTGGIKDFFYWCLFRFGFVMASYKDEVGYFFQPCTVSGFNMYYQPVKVIVANPQRIVSGEYRIGEQCELLKLTPDFIGVWDIIAYYAEKLSALDVAINTNIINSKHAFILAGRNKAAAEALKTITDRVNRGEPAVFIDRALNNDKVDKTEPFIFQPLQDIRDNYVVGEQLKDFQTILNNFDAEIGIPTIPYQKKEKMVTDEANSRDKDSVSRITVWQRSLDSSIDAIKTLYPDLDISYTLREDIENNGGVDGGNR